MLLICIKCKETLLRNIWKHIKWPKLTYMHRDTAIYLLLPRLRHPGEKLAFPPNLFCVSPKTEELIVAYCCHPLSLARGYTQGGFIAAISYCFPSDTAREVKLLQEPQQGSHCSEFEIQGYNGPHSCWAELSGWGTTRLGIWILNAQLTLGWDIEFS